MTVLHMLPRQILIISPAYHGYYSPPNNISKSLFFFFPLSKCVDLGEGRTAGERSCDAGGEPPQMTSKCNEVRRFVKFGLFFLLFISFVAEHSLAANAR